MEVLTVNSKGHIPIPSKLRKQLSLEPGSKIKLFVGPDEHLVMTKTSSIKDAFGVLPKQERTSTIEEMDKAVHEAVANHVMDSAS